MGDVELDRIARLSRLAAALEDAARRGGASRRDLERLAAEARACLALGEGAATPANDVLDPRVAKALALLRAGLGEAWPLGRLARALGMSRSALLRLFHRELGLPPGRCLSALRVQEAQRLLVETDEGLAALAGRLGYASEFAFSRAFKRQVGVAPSIVRDGRRRAARCEARAAA